MFLTSDLKNDLVDTVTRYRDRLEARMAILHTIREKVRYPLSTVESIKEALEDVWHEVTVTRGVQVSSSYTLIPMCFDGESDLGPIIKVEVFSTNPDWKYEIESLSCGFTNSDDPENPVTVDEWATSATFKRSVGHVDVELCLVHHDSLTNRRITS